MRCSRDTTSCTRNESRVTWSCTNSTAYSRPFLPSVTSGSAVTPVRSYSVIMAMDALSSVALRQHGADLEEGCAAHAASATAQSRRGYDSELGFESKSEQTNDSRPMKRRSSLKLVSPTAHSEQISSRAVTTCTARASMPHGSKVATPTCAVRARVRWRGSEGTCGSPSCSMPATLSRVSRLSSD